MNQFEKKVVVITGDGGMGVELCAAFAREGERGLLLGVGRCVFHHGASSCSGWWLSRIRLPAGGRT